MLKKKTGRIINISSVVGQIGNPGQVGTLWSIIWNAHLARELALASCP